MLAYRFHRFPKLFPRERIAGTIRVREFSQQDDNQRILVPERIVSILDDQDLMSRIPLEDVRNFCFIAHVDHGKSSLSSRILEICGNNGPEKQQFALKAARGEPVESLQKKIEKEQIDLLDTLSVERERGITVKASTASLIYPHPAAKNEDGVLLLNMIDTPGHADFGREVARSLSFVQGAILLLDATQGIQAQTWTVHEKAKGMKTPPELILALTKVDLDAARPIDVALTVSEWLSIDEPDSIIPTSARNRIGITELLDAVCRRVPAPRPLDDDDGSIFRAQVVDSCKMIIICILMLLALCSLSFSDILLIDPIGYDDRGVNCIVQILSGNLVEGDRIAIAKKDVVDPQQQSFSVQEAGLVLPHLKRTTRLGRGQMGYVRFGLRDPRQADPGTILIDSKAVGKDIIIPNLKGMDETKSVLYASVHPAEEDGFEDLCEAVDRLALNDKGLEVSRTADHGSSSSESGGPFLGPGLRVGFQGLLHAEVFRQRLLDEFGIEAVVTPPKVPYHVTFLPSKQNNLQEPYTEIVEDLNDWPQYGTKFKVEEPMVGVRIMAPTEYTGSVMELITKKRGIGLESNPLDEDTWIFEAQMPWAEVVVNFHDMLKTATAGYGSLDTFEGKPALMEARLSKVDIMLNGESVGPLSFVSYTPTAQGEARAVCKKLQEVLPRQQFVVVIQAKADGKVIASERIRAYRKDVLVKSGKVVGGGDISRKKKLLEAQKRGKKRQQKSGKVTLSQAAFNSVISR